MGEKQATMIIHIDTGKTWRGGQQQAFYLHQFLCYHGYKSVMVCKKKSFMAKLCKEYDLPVYNLPLASELDLYSAWKIVKFAKRYKGKILHLHTAHALSLGLIAKLLYKNLKLIGVRRVDFSLRKNKFSLLKYKNKLLDVLVCISENIKKVVIQDGVPESSLRLIHSGIDINKFSLEINQDKVKYRQELLTLYNIPENNLIIGTIAAFVGHKDYPTLLKSAKLVLEKRKDITFIAIGDGKLHEEIVELHKKLNLGESFILAGFQEDVKKYLHAYDIFVLSSKLEGLGTSVLDAMATQKPIVACNSGGIPEMITHKVNGLLAEKENPEDLADKLMQMINNPDLREKLSLQAEKDVEKFSILNTIQRNIDLYNELDEKALKK